MEWQEELAIMRASINCAAVLEWNAWRLDRRESSRNCLKYRRGEGEILLVTHEGRGWWHPGSTARGDVFDLVRFLQPDLNFAQARLALRPFVGVSPAMPPLAPRHRKRDVRPVEERWRVRQAVRFGSACWRYLTEQRSLPPSVIEAASREDALREGPYGSAWFAHRAHDGRLSGIEIRGPDFRGFSPGGKKTLFRLHGGEASIRRIVVAEAPIDAMSVAAIEKLRPSTLYVATAGGMGPGTIAEMKMLLRELSMCSDAKLIIATDADAAGENYAARLRDMAAESGVFSERLAPVDGMKDWNDVLKRR
jgi:hypothetical protein